MDNSITTPDQALRYLESLIEIPSSELLILARLVAVHANHCTLNSAPHPHKNNEPSSGNANVDKLSALTNIPTPQLEAGMLAWNALYEAVHTLGLPHSSSRPSFHKAWLNMGPEFPFYEQYMITAGRARELVTNAELARIMGTNVDDPDSLHEYRKVERLARVFAHVDADGAPVPTAAATGEMLWTLRGLKAGLKDIEEKLSQELTHAPSTAAIPTPADTAGTGARATSPREGNGSNADATAIQRPGPETHYLAAHETRLLNFVIGLILVMIFCTYDPDEMAGSSGLGRYLRVLPTMVTLLECFYAALRAYGVGEGGILLLLVLFVAFKCLEQGVDM
ncbi:MAG: hypothetical protein Q9196_003012 [Gyalolechia fulgens]